MAEQEFTTEELNTEVWKPISGWSNYQVSNLGRVRHIHIIKSRTSNNGYLRASLSRGVGAAKAAPLGFTIHGLVAGAFIGERPQGLVINHIDGNKLNNRPENLEYITQGENHRHAVRLGLTASGDRNGARTHREKLCRGEQVNTAKLTYDQVQELRRLFKEGVTTVELAERFGIHRSHAWRLTQGQGWWRPNTP